LGLGEVRDRPIHRRERHVVGGRLLLLVRVGLDHLVAERAGRLAARRDVDADVDEDRVQPRAEAPVAGVAEPVEGEQRAQQRLLDRVLGVVRVPEPVAGGGEERRVVLAHELREGVRVTAAVRGHQTDRGGLLDARGIRRR
jgi:hypothetical protein